MKRAKCILKFEIDGKTETIEAAQEDDDPDWVVKKASEMPQEEASETAPAKKPYPVGSKEAAEAVERVKQREAELEAERKATRRPGRKKKTAE